MTMRLDDLLNRVAANAPVADPQMQARVWAAVRRQESGEREIGVLRPARWGLASLALMAGAILGGTAAADRGVPSHELAIFHPQTNEVAALGGVRR